MSTVPSRAAWNQGVIADYRANGRATEGHFVGRNLLLLTTKGSKTGADRTTPLAYTTDGANLVVVASMGGADVHPHWYTNIIAEPIVTVELGREQFRARATTAGSAERRRLYDQHAELHPTFVEYEQKTAREIPVILLERLRADPS